MARPQIKSQANVNQIHKLELRCTFLFLGSLFQRRQVAKLVLWPQIHSLEYSWRLWSQRRKSSMKQKQKKTKQKRIVSIRFAFTKNLLTWDWSHLHVYFNSSSIYTYKFFIKTNKKLTSLHLSTFYFKQSFKCHSGFLNK